MNNIGTKTLKTERLILRRFTLDDAKEIYEGTLRNYLKLRDEYHDIYLYSIINNNI